MRGFYHKITWKLLLFLNTRDVDLTRKAGVIASPKWPIGYTQDDLPGVTKNCEWDIEANKLHVIQVNVMDVDFDGSKSWLGDNCYKKNRLKIEGTVFSILNSKQFKNIKYGL